MSCTQGQGKAAPVSSKPKIRKGLWSPEEDEKLYTYMMKKCLDGCSWSYVAKQVGNILNTHSHFNFKFNNFCFSLSNST